MFLAQYYNNPRWVLVIIQVCSSTRNFHLKEGREYSRLGTTGGVAALPLFPCIIYWAIWKRRRDLWAKSVISGEQSNVSIIAQRSLTCKAWLFPFSWVFASTYFLKDWPLYTPKVIKRNKVESPANTKIFAVEICGHRSQHKREVPTCVAHYCAFLCTTQRSTKN